MALRDGCVLRSCCALVVSVLVSINAEVASHLPALLGVATQYLLHDANQLGRALV